MRSRTLLTQVLAVNTGLVAADRRSSPPSSLATASRDAASDRGAAADRPRGRQRGAAELAAAAPPARPARRACSRRWSSVDLNRPGQRADGAAQRRRARSSRLTAGFNRMLERLEQERRDAGRAVLRAQEEERARIAQDLHDEVNQALTAILLRLQAAELDAPAGLRDELREIQALATQAMEELLTLARQLRPTALDDHGLVPALASQVADFGDRTGIRRDASTAHGAAARAHRRGAARHLPRHAGEPVQRRPALRRQRRARRAVVRRPHRPAHPRRRPRLHASRRTATAVRASASPACASARCSSAAACTSSPRPVRAQPSNSPWEPHEDPDRRRPRHRPWRAEAADRPSARHAGGRRGRRRRRGLRAGARHPPRPVRARRLDAAHDRPAGRAPDPRAPARDPGARAVHARRRALRLRRAEGRRVRLRAQARGRPGAAERDPRRPPRRRLPDQRGRALAGPRVDVRRLARARRSRCRRASRRC